MLKLGNIGNLVTYDSKRGRMISSENIELIINNGKIIEIGTKLGDADYFFDCKNKLVTPGFVDSHTHPVFLNHREDEFHLRMSEVSYEEISKNGGGILNSVESVKNASEALLVSKVKLRMDEFFRHGTTTVECKSGYGLDTSTELKSLKVIDEVNNIHEIDIVPTFMGAHDFPQEYKNNRNDYVDLICDEMIPKVAKQGVAKFNDVFCENGYFNIEQTKKILIKGREHGLEPRLHADEFSDSGAAYLAGELKVVSADHLMEISKSGIDSLAENGIIATLLPGTTFFLGKHKYAPYKRLKEAGLSVAIATDYNPGSCNIQSMPFIITLACIYFQMDIMDAIKSSTYTAAKSLMLEEKIGSIEIGKNADIIIWNLSRIEEIPYFINDQQICSVFKNGKPVFTS
tara:strand:- start:144 stop:1346 length:1203 start_codon:yes stop_codon:yes gene_type:complete